MKADEQHTTRLAPLDGFLISGSWARSVPSRPSGLEEFLASPPIPDEARSASKENVKTTAGEAPPPAASNGDHPQAAYSRSLMDEARSAITAVVAERPFPDSVASEPSPAPRTIVAEAVALASAEPRALIAPSDVLNEFESRTHRFDDRGDERSGEALRDLFEEEGLVDPSPWFSGRLAPSPSRGSSAPAPSFGLRPSEPMSGPSPMGFDGRRFDVGWESGPASFPRDDRLGESSSETFEEIEDRLSRVAAKLEEAVDRIESAASEPLSARAGGFRGRVDE